MTLLGLKESTRDIDFCFKSEADLKRFVKTAVQLGYSYAGSRLETTGHAIDVYSSGYVFCVQLPEDYAEQSVKKVGDTITCTQETTAATPATPTAHGAAVATARVSLPQRIQCIASQASNEREVNLNLRIYDSDYQPNALHQVYVFSAEREGQFTTSSLLSTTPTEALYANGFQARDVNFIVTPSSQAGQQLKIAYCAPPQECNDATVIAFGSKITLVKEHGASDVRFFTAKGIPGVVFGSHN